MGEKTRSKLNKKKPNIKKSATKNIESGFDFGLQMRVMAMADIEFNQALREAEVIGCAYGLSKVEGIFHPIPSITLVGTNSSAFVRAYQHFARWGCEEDGDVVDVDFLLQSDGSYDLWIGPEMERSMYRTIPQSDLYDVMGMNVTWIKHYDTTNKMVHDLKRYCTSGLHPVVISAAIGDRSNPTSLRLKLVPEWKGILKFKLGIIDKANPPKDSRFSRMQKQPSQKEYIPQHQQSPEDICRRRIKTLDSAFPVSRERVRRSSLIQEVRKQFGFENVSETQVIQAAINLMISGELISGDMHYRQLVGDVHKTIWDAILSRVEIANGTRQLIAQDPYIVAHQIELDVRAALKSMKMQNLHEPFPRLQEIFKQEGFIND